MVGSASWPTWMALVANFICERTSELRGEETDDVLARQHADRLAVVGDDDRRVGQRQQLVGALDLFVLLERSGNARPITSLTGWCRMSA